MKSDEPQPSDAFLMDLEQDHGASVALGLSGLAASLGTARVREDTRAGLLRALDSYARFERFEADVAQILGFSREQAAAALCRIDDAGAWQVYAPGIAFLPVSASPDAGFALSGFLRVDAGMDFPEHEHLGEELTFVLQGAFEESSSGKVYRPGEPARMAAGTRHKFRVPAGGPHLVGLATVKVGLR